MSTVPVIHRIEKFEDHEIPAWAKALVFENNVPIPANRATSGKDVVYEAIKTMTVGQSFVVPYAREGKNANIVRAGNLARATGYKFTQRTFIDESTGMKMLRIWRIE